MESAPAGPSAPPTDDDNYIGVESAPSEVIGIAAAVSGFESKAARDSLASAAAQDGYLDIWADN